MAWTGGHPAGSARPGAAPKGFTLDHPGQGIAVSPSGQRVAILYDFGGGIDVFTVDGVPIRQIKRWGFIISPAIAFLDDDHVVAPASSLPDPDAMLQIWNVTDSSEPRTVQGLVPGGAYMLDLAKQISAGPNRRWLAAFVDYRASDSVVLVDTQTLAAHSMSLHSALGRFDRIMCVAQISNLLAVGTTRGRAMVFDIETGKLDREIQAYSEAADKPSIGVGDIALSDDGRTLAVGRSISVTSDTPEQYGVGIDGADGLKLFDVTTGLLIRTASASSDPSHQVIFDKQSRAFVGVFNSRRLVTASVDASVAPTEVSIDNLSSVAAFRTERLLAILGGRRVQFLKLP